eukprot:Sspe_Gene.16442::Locus_5799_Transcript_1_1_Confidence_1.000_Length_940::g.16442::m.16442
MMRRAVCPVPCRASFGEQRRTLMGLGGSLKLTMRSAPQGGQAPLHYLLLGPRNARRLRENFHQYTKRNRVKHNTGVPTIMEAAMHRDAPVKNLPFGDKFLSARQEDLDRFFPQETNPYEDGRDYKMGSATLVLDTLPHLLDVIDDRIPEEHITREVRALSSHVASLGEFMHRVNREWGLLERLEAVSSRLTVHHIRLLSAVVLRQEQYRHTRRMLVDTEAVLRTSTGFRYYALPGYSHDFL